MPPPSTTHAPSAPSPDSLIGRSDSEFEPHTWTDLKEILVTDRLGVLGRWPSDEARYAAWGTSTRATYGSVTNFITSERLRWPVEPEAKRVSYNGSMFAYTNDIPFADLSDYRILRNDWPYRWEKGLTHIVVWMKNQVPVEEVSGKVSEEGRRMIEEFVRHRFVKELGEGGEDRVLWFKNWRALMSVATLEHFHVVVRDVPEEKLSKWTGMDTTIHEG